MWECLYGAIKPLAKHFSYEPLWTRSHFHRIGERRIKSNSVNIEEMLEMPRRPCWSHVIFRHSLILQISLSTMITLIFFHDLPGCVFVWVGTAMATQSTYPWTQTKSIAFGSQLCRAHSTVCELSADTRALGAGKAVGLGVITHVSTAGRLTLKSPRAPLPNQAAQNVQENPWWTQILTSPRVMEPRRAVLSEPDVRRDGCMAEIAVQRKNDQTCFRYQWDWQHNYFILFFFKYNWLRGKARRDFATLLHKKTNINVRMLALFQWEDKSKDSLQLCFS